MTLYSIVPIDIIFGSSNENNDYKFLEIDYLGEKVQVSPFSDNQYKINRVISTSPKAYLNPKLQPGNIIQARL